MKTVLDFFSFECHVIRMEYIKDCEIFEHLIELLEISWFSRNDVMKCNDLRMFKNSYILLFVLWIWISV